MSTCISQHGEYSDHIPGAEWSCTRCGVLDEDGLLARVAELEAERDEADATVVDWGVKYFAVCAERDTARSDGFDRGYDRAVANLRDNARFVAWAKSAMPWGFDTTGLTHAADYLEATKESTDG